MPHKIRYVLNKQGATITKGLNMRNGTQEELDAAREDARLIPMDTFFKIKVAPPSTILDVGTQVIRSKGLLGDDVGSVSMSNAVENVGFYYSANDLESIK